MAELDRAENLADAVRSARAAGDAVVIAGSGSKSFLASPASNLGGRLLSTEEHAGIVDYRPEELVVTVRAGTPLKALRQTLAREGQMLGFEPPEFRGLGTLGGAVAAGLSGPGRPWRGSVRDAVLGVEMINGLGDRLRFGGQVMKNVAGFDLSRLQAGAFGTLGVLLAVSLRVTPLPETEETRVLTCDSEGALQRMRSWARQPLAITATAFEAGELRARISGSAAAVKETAGRIGGDREPGDEYWTGLKNQTLPFFRNAGRLAVRHPPPGSPTSDQAGLVEWSGGRRWYADGARGTPFDGTYAAHRCGGGGGDEVIAEYQRRLKAAFDPDGILNGEIFGADVAA
jgi:glycolate oxidase FAD binding subunit